MLISPWVLAEMPGVNTNTHHQALLIGAPLARKSPGNDWLDVGGLFSLQQYRSQISVGLSSRQATCQPSRSL